jgi:hypothetical protein
MPGDCPGEAVDVFLEPLQRAVSCLGFGKILTSPGGKNRLKVLHAWSLNGPAGLSRGGRHFEAQMHYKIIQDDRDGYGPFRVTTRAYRYRFAVLGQDVTRFHWHPCGRSPHTEPHLHLALVRTGDPGDTRDVHLPSPRFTFESAISWAIALGWPAARSDHEDVLNDCQEPHLHHRSWGGSGPPPRPPATGAGRS